MRISDWSSDVCSSDLRRRAIIVGFRIGAVDQRPDLADTRIPAVGREQAELRIDLVDTLAVIGAAAQDDGRIPEIERKVELEVDNPGEPAFGQVGGLRLEDVDARERLGGPVLEVEGAADRRKGIAPVSREIESAAGREGEWQEM